MKETPCGQGVQVFFIDPPRKKLRVLVASDPESSQKPIQLKFSGDGTWVGKRLHVLNMMCTILDEGRQAMGERGNYYLDILKVSLKEYCRIFDF